MLPANMGSTRFTLLTLLTILTLSASASLVLAACSTSNDDEGNDPTSSSTSSGSGGAGGSGASGGAGGEYTGPCDQDCSKIEPPECYQSVCNEGAHPGPINTCTVVPISDAPCD